MSAAIGAFIASAFTELVAGVIHKVTGKSPEDDSSLKALVESVVRETMEGGLQRLEIALQEKMAALGLAFEVRELGTVLEGVDQWFKPKGGIPSILEGADVQVMPDSWHPDPEPIAPVNTDDIVTKPGNG